MYNTVPVVMSLLLMIIMYRYTLKRCTNGVEQV